MAVHRDLSKSYLDSIAEVALLALSREQAYETATNGTISVRNADGTRTIIGVGAGTDETGASAGVAFFVGDTEPPSAPTGVSFVALDGCVTGIWDGTLEDGVPADFSHVAFRADGEVFGVAKAAGSTSSDAFEVGSTYSCDAVAVDVQGNVSDPCEAVEVTVRDVSAEAATAAANAQDAADAAKEAADAASDAADELAESITEVTTEVSDLKTTVSGSAETATAALKKATTVETSLDGFEVTVAETYATQADLADVSDVADAAKASAEESLEKYATLSVTVEGVSATATSAYSNASTALTNAATAQATAEAITTKVEQEYTTTEGLAEVLGDYATEESVSATLRSYSTTAETAEMISSTVASELYTTDANGNETAIYATTASVKQTADDILTEVEKSYTTTTDLKSLLADYTTESELANALGDYVTTTTLSNYSTTDQTADSITSIVTNALTSYSTTDEIAAQYITQSSTIQTADDITDTFATIVDLDSEVSTRSTLIRESSEGLEVSRTIDGAYCPSKVVTDWEGLKIYVDEAGDGITANSSPSWKLSLSVDPDSLDIMDGEETTLASFGSTTTIGSTSSDVYLSVGADSLDYMNGDDVLASFGLFQSGTTTAGLGISSNFAIQMQSNIMALDSPWMSIGDTDSGYINIFDGDIGLYGTNNNLRMPCVIGRRSTSSTATASLSSGTVTQVKLTSTASTVPDYATSLAISGSAVRFTAKGLYEVVGSAYIIPSSTDAYGVSAFVYMGESSTFSDMDEVASGEAKTGGSATSIVVSTPPTIVDASDISTTYGYIALAVRTRGGAGTLYTGNAMTFLSVKYLGS